MANWNAGRLLTVATLLAGAATQARAQDQPQDQRTALLTAERNSAAMSRDSGLSRALLRTMRREGVLLWPGAPVLVGEAQLRKLFELPKIKDSAQLTWQPLAAEISKDSSLGVTWGVAAASVRGAPQLGRYIMTWRRDGSQWKLSALALSGVPGLALDSAPAGIPLTRNALPASGTVGPLVGADLAFAKLAGDSGAAIAFSHWAAPNATIFANRGMLTRGPAEIGQAVDGPATWQWHPVAADVARSGDLGWTAGEAIISAKGEEPNYSKYLTVWARMPDGSIRFLTDGGNARPAAAWPSAQARKKK
jgi:hypothetical protein